MTRSKLRLTILLIAPVLALWLAGKPAPALACEPIEPLENWWYRQNYQFDEAAFPEGFYVRVSYEETVLGRLGFSNLGEQELMLTFTRQLTGAEADRVISEGKRAVLPAEERYAFFTLDPGETPSEPGDWHDPAPFTPGVVEHNGDAPGGVPRPAPMPLSYTLIIETGAETLIVPFTVFFSTNAAYRSHMLVPPSTIAERAVAASAIFEGVAGSPQNDVAEDTEWIAEQGIIVGTVAFTVTRWLKNRGPDVIEVAHFGYGSDCLPVLEPDKPVIVFLDYREPSGVYQLIETYGWYGEALAEPSAAAEIAAALGVPLPTVAATVAVAEMAPVQATIPPATEGPAGSSPNTSSAASPDIMIIIALAFLAIMLVAGRLVARMRKERDSA